MLISDGCDLRIGVSDKKKDIYIPQSSRFLNTLVLGNKGTGKSSLMLKEFAYQTISDRNVGATFITSSKDLSFELYVLAKHYKRRVVFINPSVSYDVEYLIENGFSKEDIDLKFDFKKYIFNNYIVIIDLENIINGSKGINFVSCLLNNLKNSMQNSELTCSRPHFLYIDDAFLYLDCIEDILYYGNEYNVSTTLFFQNRSQFKKGNVDYGGLIDSNTCNTIIMNSMNVEDARFYSDILDINLVGCSKPSGKFFYNIRSKDGNKVSGVAEIRISEEIYHIVCEDLYSVKRTLKRKKNKEKEKILSNINEKVSLSDELNAPTSQEEKDSKNEKIEQNLNIIEKVGDNLIHIEEVLPTVDNNNSNKFISDVDIFDDGKIELSIDWDDFDE